MDEHRHGSFSAFLPTPVGLLEIRTNAGLVTAIHLNADPGADSPDPPPVLLECRRQLEEYFAGRRRVFDLPLHMSGTPFQLQVWRAVQVIPFGSVCAYCDIAAAIGRPAATRAVGGANHRNPLPIVVPCHRVIGADGSLTGYGGGLGIKEWLLAHERRVCAAEGGK